MTDFANAARILRTVLQAENAALRQVQTSAAFLQPGKEAAAITLTQAAASAPLTDYNRALALQIQELAAENATLLATAIAVQTRVIAIMVRAARISARATERPGYDRAGTGAGIGTDATRPAMALMHRA